MYQFENKQKCLTEDIGNVYCVVRTVVRQNNFSDTWAVIEGASRDDTAYQHYLLDRGVCLKTCERLYNSLTKEQLACYDSEQIVIEEPHIYDSNYIPGMEAYKRKYRCLINICLNYELQRDYNLTGYSEIEHCTTSQDLKKPLTSLHAVCVLLYGIIVFLVIRATFYDNRDAQCSLNNNNSPDISKDDVLMEFSLNRSFRRLLSEPRTKLQHDFAFIESVRIVTVFLITTLHTLMALGASPLTNPNVLEAIFGNAFVRMISTVFPFLVHMFFTISGMLLVVHFLEFTETTKAFSWRYLFLGMMHRYLRMLPSYFTTWLYQVTWLDRIGSGPISYRLIGIEQRFCMKNSWANFLFINNYYKYHEPCMQQTWYIAADFQFCCVGMMIMMLIWRFPAITKKLLAGMLLVSILAPIVNTYIHNFSGVVLLSFKHLRFMMFHNEWIIQDYVLSHVHTCSFFSGIFAGLVYHRSKGDPHYLRNLIVYKRLKVIAPAMVVLLSAPATLFYRIKPRSSSLLMAIYASAHRNFFAIACATGLLYGATDGSKMLPAITKHPIVLAIGRLSFCVYMVQFSALRSLLVDAENFGFTLSVPNFVHTNARVFGLSYGFGLLLCVTVELPLAALHHVLLETQIHLLS
ncbi:nose resistant to fluoxetine protein 6-like [Toxorhynchites rutilus septentrionalis]|uniref:nose resistant to fluoxetine protein 6-like n=1 Tax=Toxorhynchites rutilus septentrionalis TaxID=329112 RepID=UPI0024791E76|nr:nose resistant to fluoxetine protein 6-like [Toxorhynchites rutilus septentrionalis]